MADPLRDALIATRDQDRRLAAIGHRLAVAADGLCDRSEWRPGFAVHHLSQYGRGYRDAAIRAFGLGPEPAVLAVVPGSPAALAGMREDDRLVAVDGLPVPPPDPRRGRGLAGLSPVLDALDEGFADGSAELRLDRSGTILRLRIDAERGCPSRFELATSRRLAAHADGRIVQVTTALAAWAPADDELAAAVAHELAHNLLGHRARLDQAGTFADGRSGRNAALVRAMETEADRLSIHLLDRAGYDLDAALAYWRRLSRHGLNFLVAPTHPNWGRRIAAFEAEIEAVRQARAAGSRPAPPVPAAGPFRLTE